MHYFRSFGVRYAGLLAVTLLTVLFYWKLVLTDQYVWFDHPDMVNLELPRLQYQAHQIHNHHFPLWDPYIWCGQPLIGQTQPGPLNPLNLLFLLMPLEDGYLRADCLNLYYVALHLLSALFFYALGRELGLGKRASALGACVFSFAGFLGTVPWLDVMSGGIWSPLVALFLLRAARGHRPWASASLCGLFLGLAWLSGHHEVPLLVSLSVLVAWGILVACNRRLAGAALLCFLVAGLIGAMQLWPTLEFGRDSRRWTGTEVPVTWNERVPYRIHTIYSLPPQAIAETVVPNSNTYGDTSPFVGSIALALALFGLAAHWHDARIRWLAAFTLAGLVYSLGAFTPLHGFLYGLVPNLAKARLPVRALHLVGLGLALLAAFGLDALLARAQETWTRRLAWTLGLFGLFVLAVLTAGLLLHHQGEARAWVSGAAALTAGVLIAAFHRRLVGPRVLTVALLGLLLTELTGLVAPSLAYRGEGGKELKFAGQTDRYRDLAAFLKSEPGPVRVVVNDTDVPINFGDQEGIETHEGYVAGIPESHFRMELHTPRVRQLIGITHLLANQPGQAGQQAAFTGKSGVKVYRVPGAMPRAWTVHEVSSVAGFDELVPRLQDPALDFHRRALLIGAAPALETCPGEDSVRILRKGPDRVTLSVTARCRALLILADSFAPGWRVKIDGRGGDVLPVFGMLRGVVVASGAHTVDMIYRPVSVLGGMALTLCGLLLTAIVCRLDRAALAPSH